MQTSTIHIYKDCKILPSKGFLVEGVDTYLSTLSNTITLSDFQYIKHDSIIQLKIDTKQLGDQFSDQKALDPGGAFGKYNYLDIKNSSDTTTFRYFIIDKSWASANTIILTCELDSINTWKLGTDYSFTDRTKINRQHKDRIYNSYVTVDDVKKYRRKIDFQSEGITPLQYKQNDITLYENALDVNFYLMYIAKNELTEEFPPQAVDTFIMANRPLSFIGSGVQGYVLDVTRLNDNYYYFFGSDILQTQSGTFTINDVEYTIGHACYLRRTSTNYLELHRFTGNVVADLCEHQEVLRIPVANVTSVVFNTGNNLLGVAPNKFVDTITGNFSSLGIRVAINATSSVEPEGSGTAAQIDDIFSVDRSDSRLFKIIKLPYAPFELTFSESGDLIVPAYISRDKVEWINPEDPESTIIKYYLKVSSSHSGAFENLLETNDLNIFDKLFTVFSSVDERNDDNESKLLHSDFQTNRFVYDSFAYPIQLENISKERLYQMTPDTDLAVNFVTTSTMNSRFLFDFKNVGDYKSTSDYDHILSVNRNNEIPIYNSDYINYIRTGQNYDQKIKNAAVAQGVFGIVGGAVSTGIGLAGFGVEAVSGIRHIKTSRYAERYAQAEANIAAKQGKYKNVGYQITSPPPNVTEFKSAGLLGNLVYASQLASGISSIASGISTINQANAAYEQKQKQAEMSGVSVAGSDDIDLLTYYSNGNKAKLCEFKAGEKIMKLVADLFYYYGYYEDSYGVPNTTGRKWFNYVQCESPEFDDTLPKEWEDNLKARYELGVTILHKNSNSWDFEQEKANNESWLETEV